MKSISMVRKRDGRLVEFDETKIADAIYKAALSVGGEDRFLAEELGSVVSLFIEKTYPEVVPTIEDVQDMVEKVLIETGHARTAKAYILYREKRSKLREATARPSGPVQRDLFEPEPVVLLDPVTERTEPFDADSLALRLMAETDLPEDRARTAAAAVEERLRSLGRPRVGATLFGRIVDFVLLELGHESALGRRGTAGLSRHHVEEAVFPKEGARRGTPGGRVGGAILRQYAFAEVYPEDVAAAHLDGRIRLAGVSSPTSVFAASFSPDAIRSSGIPGLTGRFRAGAVGSPRRFAAHLGRVVRSASRHVSHGLSLSRLNLLMAPLLGGIDHSGLREEAWHILSGLAGLPEVELELGLAPPAVLAARMARGPDGEILSETYSRFTGTSLQLASAFLEVRGTGAGLGPRAELPRLALTLGPGALEEDAACAVIARAVGEAMARDPVLFVLDREDLPLLGTSRVRVRLEDATRLTNTQTLSVAVGARAVVNLPRAAYRAGPGDPSGFLTELEEAAKLAVDGIRARRGFLARAAAGPDGPLAPLARPRGDTPALLDIEGATHSLGVLGLNEAVAFASGEELHESDDAVKLGQRALGVLQLSCRRAQAEALPVELDAEDDPDVARWFAVRDREAHASLAARIPDRYTGGVAFRSDAPIDLAVRLDSEGRLAMTLRTTTVRCLLSGTEHPAPETVIALLRKTWRNTRVRQVLLGRGEAR